MGGFRLTWRVKLGYNGAMIQGVLVLVLRIGLVVVLWALVWGLIQPKSQLMRVFRAAVLVAGLLVILAVVRLAG
jgi:hypothetical protein